MKRILKDLAGFAVKKVKTLTRKETLPTEKTVSSANIDDPTFNLDQYFKEMHQRHRTEKKLRKFQDANVSYNSELDRVILTLMYGGKHRREFTIEVERNSYEDRYLRKRLLSENLISEDESKPSYVRRIMPEFLATKDMPDPVYSDEYPLGQGEGEKEVVWEIREYPHMVIIGQEGTGKTNLTRNILTYAFHRAESHFYEIDLSIEDPKPLTLYRNMSRGCKTTLDDAFEAVEMFYNEMKWRYKDPDSCSGDKFLLIENAHLILPPPFRPQDEQPDDLEKKKQIKVMLDEIIEFGEKVKNMHLVVTLPTRTNFEYLLDIKHKDHICYVSLGRISPEDSRYLFGENGGYFVSPYIKGRGYFGFGNKPGMEFQSYFIEDDYKNNLAYFQQLDTRQSVRKASKGK